MRKRAESSRLVEEDTPMMRSSCDPRKVRMRHRQLEAVNIGHVVVGHDKADIGIGLEDIERLRAAVGKADAKIIPFQTA